MCGVDGTLCANWFGNARPFCDVNTSRCVQQPVHDCVSTMSVDPTNLTTFLPAVLPKAIPGFDRVWPAGSAAAMCASYLPPESDVCCRPQDEGATDWLIANFQNYERLFGQCDNCLGKITSNQSTIALYFLRLIACDYREHEAMELPAGL
jgi:hypothetical protein